MTHGDYETCARTYATFIVYPEELDPARVTERLEIQPSSLHRRGEPNRWGKPALIHYWGLESNGRVASDDSQRHVDWLLDHLVGKNEVLHELQGQGCRLVISFYWLSQYGHGGPTIPAAQMRRLGELGIELWFDCYFASSDEDTTPLPESEAGALSSRIRPDATEAPDGGAA